MRRLALPALLLSCLCVAPSARAVTYCVSNAAELQAALSAAAASTVDDSIRLHQGIFTPGSAGFTYQSQNTGWLDISGGWRSINATPCDEQVGNAATTVLDGAGQFRGLSIVYVATPAPTAGPRYTLTNFTIANGKVFGQTGGSYGGGLLLASYVDTPTRLWLDNMIIHYNTTEYFTGGAQVSAYQGEIRIVNSLFDSNSAPVEAVGHLDVSMVGTTTSLNQRVVVANNTFVNGTCLGATGRPCGMRVYAGPQAPVTLMNNLFANNAINDVHLEGSGPLSASYNLMRAISGNNPNFSVTNGLTGSPGFINAAGGDFRLSDTSELLDKGSTLGVPGGYYGYDLAAGTRVRFAAIDPGAYENQTQEIVFRHGFE